MTEELKTLKDIHGENVAEIKFDIKAEAIKDIKEFSKSSRNCLEIEDGADIDFSDKSVIAYIKWKFNLTEEDLK